MPSLSCRPIRSVIVYPWIKDRIGLYSVLLPLLIVPGRVASYPYAAFFVAVFRFRKYLLLLSPCSSNVARELLINQTPFDFLVRVILLFSPQCFKPIFQLFKLYISLGLGHTFLANFVYFIQSHLFFKSSQKFVSSSAFETFYVYNR